MTHNSVDRPPTLILSPYRGHTYINTDYAKACMKDSLSRGEAPFASHLLYPQLLDDSTESERTIGFECEKAWLAAAATSNCAAVVAVYVDRGVSEGMLETLNLAISRYRYKLKIEFRKLPSEGESI